MRPKCSPHIAPSGVPCIRPPMPQGSKRPRLPVMSVNSVAPDKNGNVVVGIPELEQLKGKVVQLENDDHAYSLLKIIAEALGMQVGAGGSWTGTSYVSLGAFATKNTIGPDDLTPELKAQLKGDKGDAGQVGPRGPQGIQGVQGERGERGPQGERGDTGDQGPQGLQGPQGAPLVVTRTQETSDPGGYNVVMLSDGSTLNIRNGNDGPAGQKGEQGERGEKGDTGEKGEKGAKGDKGADGTVAFEYLTDEQKASLKGDKGDPGETPTIDSELDLMSSNPVMNSAVTAELYNLRALVASQYYPDGDVKVVSELTAGLKYNFAADGPERTATVKPFCNTGDPANDNSGLVGRVVIPPFVDASGNPYIYDDGTRYKVVGVSGVGSPANYTTNLTTLIAPSTVTDIGSHAFNSCIELASVSLPAVATIGDDAFSGCDMLTSVSLPAATTLKEGALSYCTELKSVSLPVATTIARSAFNYCTGLTSVSLPAVTTIEDGSFFSCTGLASVDFGDTPRSSVPTLGAGVFGFVPTSCKIIVPDAQYDKWIAASNWGALVTAGYTFLRHSEWEYARKYEVDNKANRPATFTTGNLAELDSNGNLVDSGVAKGDFEPVSLFTKYYPEGNVKSEAEFTRGINYNAPDITAHTITVKAFPNSGDPANDNSGLVGRVVIPPFVDADGNPYISDDGTRYKVVGVSDGSAQFTGNDNLTTVIAPSTVTTIGNYAFNSCFRLASVSLPSATTIGFEAFRNCFKLSSVSLPAATTIENSAFLSCSGLASVSLPSATTIGESAFSECNSLTSVSLPAATTIGNDAFSSCYGIESVSLPAAKTIGYGAFRSCSGLSSVYLPAATTIGNTAFAYCTGMTTVSLPAATTIGHNAFDFCTGMTTVSLPAVTSIDLLAFNSCSGLSSVDFGDTPRSSVPALTFGAFDYVPTSCKMIVPDAQYDAWVAASGWSDLVTAGYTFLRHSEWSGS